MFLLLLALCSLRRISGENRTERKRQSRRWNPLGEGTIKWITRFHVGDVGKSSKSKANLDFMTAVIIVFQNLARSSLICSQARTVDWSSIQKKKPETFSTTPCRCVCPLTFVSQHRLCIIQYRNWNNKFVIVIQNWLTF